MEYKKDSGTALTIAGGPRIKAGSPRPTIEWDAANGKKELVLKEAEMVRLSEAIKNEH